MNTLIVAAILFIITAILHLAAYTFWKQQRNQTNCCLWGHLSNFGFVDAIWQV